MKDGENGFLVPQKDSKERSEAVLKLMENEALLDEFGKNGRELVLEKYRLNRIADDTFRVYIKLRKNGSARNAC